MNDNEKIAKVKEIFADKDFVAKVLAMETAEEVQAAVKAQGVELTIEEIEATKAELVNQLENKDSDEVSDEQLENVAGGFAVTTIVCAAIIGAGAVGGLATLAKGVHEWTRRRW